MKTNQCIRNHTVCFQLDRPCLIVAILVLDIFPQIYASICRILSRQTFTHSCVGHFPIKLRINLSCFVVKGGLIKQGWQNGLGRGFQKICILNGQSDLVKPTMKPGWEERTMKVNCGLRSARHSIFASEWTLMRRFLLWKQSKWKGGTGERLHWRCCARKPTLLMLMTIISKCEPQAGFFVNALIQGILEEPCLQAEVWGGGWESHHEMGFVDPVKEHFEYKILCMYNQIKKKQMVEEEEKGERKKPSASQHGHWKFYISVSDAPTIS